jgi:hypothetical protein
MLTVLSWIWFLMVNTVVMTVDNVRCSSGRRQNLLLNSPVSAVSRVSAVKTMRPSQGNHVGSTGVSRVTKGALRTLQPHYPKIQSIFVQFCSFFAHTLTAILSCLEHACQLSGPNRLICPIVLCQGVTSPSSTPALLY